MGFKIGIIKVMIGAKKSKKLNLKEKAIFRNGNGEEKMPRSYKKDEPRKTRRQEEFGRSNFYYFGKRQRRKKEKNKTNKCHNQTSTGAHSETYMYTVVLSPLKLQSKEFSKNGQKTQPTKQKIHTHMPGNSLTCRKFKKDGNKLCMS